MTSQNETRRAGVRDRASQEFRLATEHREDIRNALSLQLAFLARRLGAIDPATLAVVASLAFGEVAR